MPNIFKALASIAAWALFIMGLGSLAWSSVESLFISVEGVTPFQTIAWFAWATLTLFLAVVVMKLRKGLE